MACEGGVGSTNPDIAGLGIIVSFAIQAGVSLVLSVWAYVLQGKEPVEDSEEIVDPIKSKRKLVQEVLGSVSDIQTFTGISLLIAAITQFQSLDLYHFHIVYDTVNFTSVSFCAALVNILDTDRDRRTVRLLAVATFSILYLLFAILFGIALGEWDDQVNGRCYITANISAPSAEHPYMDKVYLGVTCFFLYYILYCALPPIWDIKIRIRNRDMRIRDMFMKTNLLPADIHAQVLQGLARFKVWLDRAAGITGIDQTFFSMRILYPLLIGPWRPFLDGTYWDSMTRANRQNAIMIPILCQYPLHLYFIFTMRRWNADLLEGDSEDAWGFGQVAALVLLVPTVQQCVEAVLEYRKIREDFKNQPSGNRLGTAEQPGSHHLSAEDTV